MATREHPTLLQPPVPPVPARARRVPPRGSRRPPVTSPGTSWPPGSFRAARLLVEAAGHPGTLRLVGELDCSTIGYARDALRLLMLRSGRLTLDLSHLTFMGSEGLDLFTDLARAREGIGLVVVSNPGRTARRLLGIGRLDQLPNLRIDPEPGRGPARIDVPGSVSGTGTLREAST